MRDRFERHCRRSSASSGWSSQSDGRRRSSDSGSRSDDADALAARFEETALHETRYSDQDFAVAPGDGRARPTEAAEGSCPGDAALRPSSPPEAQPYAQQLSGTLGMPGSFSPAGPSHVLGPFLRFSTILDEGTDGAWYGSILVVSRTDGPAPSLELLTESAGAGRPVSLPTEKPLPLDAHRDQTFWRLELRVPVLPDDDQLVSARTSFGGRDTVECRFVVAASRTPLRIAFYSCNGVSSDVKDPGILNTPDLLWDDIFERHTSVPFHYMIGGGDQIYCDEVWTEVPACVEWLAKSLEDRVNSTYEGDDVKKVEEFYFNLYKKMFGEGRYAQALRSIPSVMILDDHDIFDGAGTYPENLRASRFMSGVASTGYKFYLLFQLHTTADFAKAHNFFGYEGANHYIAQLGPDVAVVCHDGRRERRIDQISHPKSYDMMEERLQSDISPSTKHVLVATGVPILYPRLEMAENALQTVAVFNSRLSTFALFQKANAFQSIMSPLANQPDLLDDLGDHWTAPPHEMERLRVIEMFQKFAVSRTMRVTFLGGDVHCCCTGRFKGTDPAHNEDIRRDPYFMLQVVSSAMQNSPPPPVVITALHTTAELIAVNMHSNEAMIDLFGRDANENRSLSGYHKLLARRNWATIHQDAEGGLRIRIRAEGGTWGSGKVGAMYGVVAPPLMV